MTYFRAIALRVLSFAGALADRPQWLGQCVRSARKLALCGLLAVVVSSCSSGPTSAKPHVTTGAPPLVVCGQTLWRGASGIVIDYYTHPGDYRLSDSLIAGQRHPVVIGFSRSCATGVHGVTIEPHGHLSVTAKAYAKDRSIVAIAVIVLRAGDATIVATTAHGETIRIHVTSS